MKPIPINTIFSFTNLIRDALANYKEILLNSYETDGEAPNKQIVFTFNKTLFEAALLNEKTADSIVFCVLHGLAEMERKPNDRKELEKLLNVLPTRIQTLFPTFFENFIMCHDFGKSTEKITFLQVWFHRKTE